MMPSCDHTGVPHFHSSTTPGSASLISWRILRRVSPRQSPSSVIRFEMSTAADWPWLFMGYRTAWRTRRSVAASHRTSSRRDQRCGEDRWLAATERRVRQAVRRSEEHTSELQSHLNTVCLLLLEKKNT